MGAVIKLKLVRVMRKKGVGIADLLDDIVGVGIADHGFQNTVSYKMVR